MADESKDIKQQKDQIDDIIKSLQSDLTSNIEVRKDLQSRIDEQKKIRDTARDSNLAALQEISQLTAKIQVATDTKEVTKLGKQISKLEKQRTGFTTAQTSAINSLGELKEEFELERVKGQQLRAQLKQNRESLKSLKELSGKVKAKKTSPSLTETTEVSMASAIQNTIAKKTKTPGTALVPISKSTQLTRDVGSLIDPASGRVDPPNIKQLPSMAISSVVQDDAKTKLTTRRAVGFHDPYIDVPYADYTIVPEPKKLPGAKKLKSGVMGTLGTAKQKLLGRDRPQMGSGQTPLLLGEGVYKNANPQSNWDPSPRSPWAPPTPPVPPKKKKTDDRERDRAIKKLIGSIRELTDEIERTSRTLSTDWADAAKILAQRVFYSFDSAINSIVGQGRFARREEIQQAQEVFGQQFGGVMRTSAATEMAGTARSLNIMPDQYISALRPLSGILGDIGKAQIRIQRTTQAFMKAGLTGKDAAQFFAENSEIVARNGSRFQDSLSRAAIEAKKAGFSLKAIEGFGDRIVSDFEGFLEDATAMAAMGVQFDVSNLAEAALSGNTEEIKNALQSQLQAQGLTVENLNRAQRIQLERTVGMPLDEIFKIQKAEDTAESVTAQLDMDAAQMQSEAANLFRVAVAAFETAVIGFGVAVLGMRASSLFKGAAGLLVGGGKKLAGIGGSLLTKGGIGGNLLRGGVGGLVGAGVGMAASSAKDAGKEKTGAGLDVLSKVTSMGGLGSFFGPIGTAIGALVGLIWGVYDNFTVIKDGILAAWDKLKSAFSGLIDKVIEIGKAIWNSSPLQTIFGALTKATEMSERSKGMARDTSSTATPNTNNLTQQTQVNSQTLASTPQYAPAVNMPNNAEMHELMREFIRKSSETNQKLDTLASQTITVNMDGQKVGNIIKRNAMVASTASSTARSNG